MAKKTIKSHVNKSAATGKFVSKKALQAKPKQNYIQTVSKKVGK
jgi:hypothetical protein